MKPRKNILVMRLGAMGDILFTTPALRGLRTKYPDAYITYVCLKQWRKILYGNPNIDRVVGIPYREPKALGMLLRWPFDLIVNLHDREDAAWLCAALDAKQRLGHRIVDGVFTPDENSYLLQHDPDILNSLKQSKKSYPDLFCRIAQVPCDDLRYDFFTPWWAKKWAAWNMRNHIGPKTVALHTHSRGMLSKTWPVDHVRQVVRHMPETRFIVMGYRRDIEITAPLEEEPNVKVDYSPIQVQAEMIRRCALFVGIDSGPRQVAAAVRTPALCLFGPRPAAHLPEFPGDRNLVTPCADAACYHDECPHGNNCLTMIPPETIGKNIHQMLSPPRKSPETGL